MIKQDSLVAAPSDVILESKDQQHLRGLLALQDRDRQMVAYEIHDGFAQELAAAIMQFEMLGRFMGRSDDEVRQNFEVGMQGLRDCMREARQLIRGLRSPVLDELGLAAAIDDLISRNSSQDKAKIEFVHHLDRERLAPAPGKRHLSDRPGKPRQRSPLQSERARGRPSDPARRLHAD